MSNTAIKLKKSGETGNTPSDLIYGEMAINYADGKLFYKNDLNQIEYITNQDTFGAVMVDNTLILATSPTDILTIEANSNIKLTPDEPRKGFFIDLADSIVLNNNVTSDNVIVNNILYSGLAARSAIPLPNLIAQFAGNNSTYVQVNIQNIDGRGSSDLVLTSDVGDDTSFYIDLGIQGSADTLGNLKPLDGYLLVQGSTGQFGGNLIIGTTSGTPELETRVVSGGIEDENVIVIFKGSETHILNNLIVDGTITGDWANNIQSDISVVFDVANSAFDKANAAFNRANTGGGGGGGGGSTANVDFVSLYGFPIGDYGSVADPVMVMTGLGDILLTYDMRVDPFIRGVIPIDFGYLS